MKKTASSIIRLFAIPVMVLILIAGLVGCSGGNQKPAAATTPATSAAAAASAPKTSASTAAKAPAPSAMPKLNDIAYSLALENGQEYTASTTPIYLKANQVLHMNWMVVKGGNHFHMTFTLPSGKAIAVTASGNLAAISSVNSLTEELTRNGSLVFRPSDNAWEDGYYIFHSHILSGDAAVSIKLLYWIEG